MHSLKTHWSIVKGMVTKNRPFYVQYYTIAQCNLACRMCNIVEANSDLKPVSMETVEKIAKNLKKVGAGVVLLTGGEPFLHPDLSKMVEIFCRHGLSPRLQTAGLATRDQLQACYDAGARNINISLDSLIEDKQDYLNGDRKGSWRAAIRAMSHVNQVFRSKNRICAIGCVLSRHNYMEIPAIIEFASAMGWWVSLVPAHITPPTLAKNFQGTDVGFSFLDQSEHHKLDDLLEKLKQMKGKYLLFDSISYLESSIEYLKTGTVSWRRFNKGVCDAPNLYFAILPNGDFATCCDHRYQGRLSVAQDGFAKIFYSKNFRNSVAKTTSSCSGCNYGSYPEISLLARDPKAMWERLCFLFNLRKPEIPQVEFEGYIKLASRLREKYGLLSAFERPEGLRPPALSQRYGATKSLTRESAVMEWKHSRPSREKSDLTPGVFAQRQVKTT